ncbi:MAG: hypothetical protein H5T98_01065 [Syntrophomonadaceae bacterium]|nr:hypothetical protein [Syntrophomonadaceae bacterium]
MKVVVHTPFTLTRDNGEKVRYEMGVKEMPDADAKHWFAQIHIDIEGKPKAAPKAAPKAE